VLRRGAMAPASERVSHSTTSFDASGGDLGLQTPT
jgi:hypothetical protein